MTVLKNGQPNALDFFGIRELRTFPKHFDFVTVEMRYNLEDSIRKWIKHNLKGRFYIGRSLNDDFNPILKIGFESHKELSYFMLACPHLKYA